MRGRFGVLIVIAMFSFPGCLSSGAADVFYGDDIDPPRAVDQFVLIDENGEYFSMSEFDGKVVVVTFLFTRCPDICPVVSANLAFVSQELGELYGSEVEILTITVDPWTDNSSVLENYSSVRQLSWPHLTGSVDELEPVWENFDVGLATYDTDTDNQSSSGLSHPSSHMQCAFCPLPMTQPWPLQSAPGGRLLMFALLATQARGSFTSSISSRFLGDWYQVSFSLPHV